MHETLRYIKGMERIKALPILTYPIQNKPILDLRVFTKNRCSRVTGSLKDPRNRKRTLVYPIRDLFMITRMCDRLGPPTYFTQELGLSSGCLASTVQDCNVRCTKRARVGRKRGVSDITPNPGPKPARKHMHIR